jgi:phosphoserine phosphatase
LARPRCPNRAKQCVSLARALGAARPQTLAIGDGANDLKMMAEAAPRQHVRSTGRDSTQW